MSGFTMVEMLVVSVILFLLIGGLIFLMTGFRKSFDKGEESVVILQESGLFLAMLRNDLINATMDKRLPQNHWNESIGATPEKISFNVFGNPEGTKIVPVMYEYSGSSIKRTFEGRTRTIVNGHVASLSWKVESETFSDTASGVKRLWIDINAIFSGKSNPGKKEISGKTIKLNSKLFPVRLIKQINCQQS
ncbi:MAG: hypothetical protein HQM08_03855 [Candidatus Riflebacteria bacterium]|nr:hypothetical protein [Candidatus Riflebacteria bacterium]